LRTIVKLLTLNSKKAPVKLSTENVNYTREEFSLELKEEYALN